jgi:L-ascorbate metabolism protein UlaG (beta-lactamase superfamily)
LAKNPYYRGPVSDHFDGERFFYPGGPRDKTRRDLWGLFREPRAAWPKDAPTLPCPRPPARVEGADIRATFVGHSTYLVQTQGLNLLTDPVWSSHAGPLGRLGPKRATRPGLALEDLPPLDAILLSHNHYDHLDLATLARLARARPCPVWTPLGNDTLLKRHDSRIDARALDWGQSAKVGSLKVTLEPALHWSARGLGDRRMALWGSFMIEGPDGRLFYAGDTGFGDGSLFSALAERYEGPLRLAILPIGAYAPRWFMREQHCDPDEAVAIFQALGAERAVACHWGTFQLTTEPYDEPPKRLAEALAQAGIARNRFLSPVPGGVVEIATHTRDLHIIDSETQ